ncbi:F-box protein PP2-B11 [Dichanthelium oligosanthes]|uniref:F-box protein PP2-B11 n=1 Tax=Dichanthelium oligosanthes TaxID=888268 RepID=A0A1E5V5W1_9POAL|nr:F-box protein PP2-B11 [Dichanthelium oligosanthes]
MAAEENQQETRVGDLPEACLAHAIALTSPRDACRCAAVSPAFRAAADSDHVWSRFIPAEGNHRAAAAAGRASTKKNAYLGLCEGGVPVDGDVGCRLWLDKASGAKCYALSARRLGLPWDDGEFSWRWVPHPRSRFGEVAELMDCTFLDIYGRLPAAALTPATSYAAYLVYGTAQGHRGLSFPDQETAVSLGSRAPAEARARRLAVCLRPDEAEVRKFWGAGVVAPDGGGEEPRLRDDGWWEVEMGRLRTTEAGEHGAPGEEVVASFEVLGSYPKRGLIVEGIEFRALH